MNPPLSDHLQEALRLVRDGRPGKATRLLRRSLVPSSYRQDHPAGGSLKGAVQDLLDRLRPTPRPEPQHGDRWLHHSFSAGGARRDYRLYLPHGYRGQPVPLVVMLHGCTQSPEDFAAGTRMNEVAVERTFLVAYPSQSAEANRSRCWNWFNPGDQGRDGGEPMLIAGIARAVAASHAVNPRRIFVAGLSAGGAAAALVACAYPDLFTAVGVHSGLPCGAAGDVPSAFAAMRDGMPRTGGNGGRLPLPTIVIHGDRDTTVHPRNGEQVLAQALAGQPVSLRRVVENGRVPGGHAFTRSRHLDEAGRCRVEHWLVHGGAHAWSGGSAAGTYTDPHGPDAARAMLDFFLAQST